MLNRLNDILRGQLAQFRIPVIENQHAHVPIELDGEVIGAFAAWTPPQRALDGTDGMVMRILAGQTAVALQNSALFTKSVTLLTESEARNAELLATQRELGAAQRHQVLNSERHRIARELHDSVAQTVLSAGMQIEVCRSEVEGLGGNGDLVARLDLAKDLTRSATEQLRSAIYALNQPGDAYRSSLAEMLEQLATVHMPEDLRVTLRVDGTPAELPSDVEHALLRIAGEALFNTAMHGKANSRDRAAVLQSPPAISLVDRRRRDRRSRQAAVDVAARRSHRCRRSPSRPGQHAGPCPRARRHLRRAIGPGSAGSASSPASPDPPKDQPESQSS